MAASSSRRLWRPWKTNEGTIYAECCNACRRIGILCTERELPDGPVRPLNEHRIEFNYLERSLPENVTLYDGQAEITRQAYRVILIDRDCDVRTEAFLSDFRTAGDTVAEKFFNPTYR